MHFFVVKKPNPELFFEESRRVREDFDKLWASGNDVEVRALLEKYELFIE